jgi:hypothetical protein
VVHADASPVTFEVAGPAMMRACAHRPFPLPAWPELDDRQPAAAVARQAWLRQVWAIGPVAEAVSHASPDLARAVQAQCAAEPAHLDARKLRRSMLALARYVLRMTGRPTPFGLLAGVAPARFGPGAAAVWGTEHRAIAQPAAGWLADVVTRLETDPALLIRLRVVVNSTATVRGEHLIVPHQPHPGDSRSAVPTEVLIRQTPAVRAVVAAAAEPVRVGDLVAKLQADAPGVPADAITTMLSALVARRVLITDLHARSTDIDLLAHLVRVLDEAGAGELDDIGKLLRLLRQTSQEISEHNTTVPAGCQAQARDWIAEGMRPCSGSSRHPLALDLRLDADVTLPQQVADDVAEAALALARLSEYPYGTPSWRDYHRIFYERYGLGALVSILELVDPDSGIGLPAGYPGTLVDAPRSPVKRRDEQLLALAQEAALEDRTEVVLDDDLISALDAGPDPVRLPSHLELAVRVNAATTDDLRLGRYTLELVQVSRNVGGLTGRFLGVLDPDVASRHAAAWTDLPGPDDDTVLVQASFPPLDPATAHVTRAPRTLPTVLSLAEHRPADAETLTVHDLAVGCDGRRLYLAVPAWGTRIEVSALHSLNLRTHTPPLARFLIELTRSRCAQVTGIRWGAAATLPFKPRVRYGRTILAPATWRLSAADEPGPEDSSFANALAAWRHRRRMPAQVRLVIDDRRLLLNLTQPGHRELLRRHLETAGVAILTEVVDPSGTGWCAGRPHEIIVPLRASAPPRWPALPRPTPARVIRRGHGDAPGVSKILYARLYGDLRRQDVVLADHLPTCSPRSTRNPSGGSCAIATRTGSTRTCGCGSGCRTRTRSGPESASSAPGPTGCTTPACCARCST